MSAGLREVSEFADVPAAAAAVKGLVQPGDVVLLKASRATGLEKVAAALRAAPGSDSAQAREPA
jgi:UDP-N-acetylmuramoyl-tripeptide--D-alanyl-D-alanine ligase